MPGLLEFGAAFSPSSVQLSDKLLRVVFSYFGIYSGAGAVLSESFTFQPTEMFDDFTTVCENLLLFSDWFAVDD